MTIEERIDHLEKRLALCFGAITFKIRDLELRDFVIDCLTGGQDDLIEKANTKAECEMKNPPNRAILSEGNNTLKESKDEKESGPGK